MQESAWCHSQGLPTAFWPQPSSELPTSAPAAQGTSPFSPARQVQTPLASTHISTATTTPDSFVVPDRMLVKQSPLQWPSCFMVLPASTPAALSDPQGEWLILNGDLYLQTCFPDGPKAPQIPHAGSPQSKSSQKHVWFGLDEVGTTMCQRFLIDHTQES